MNRLRQQGFSLVSAIFLITILASLAAFLLVTSGVSQQTPVIGMNGSQAYHAARSGLEWGSAGAINNDTVASCTGSMTLGGYEVNVNCAQSTHDGVNYYAIVAVATVGTPGNLNFATRTLRATVSAP